MKEFIDIHNHLIVNFDDGPAKFETVERMLVKATETGTCHIIATSHFQEYTASETLQDYYDKLTALQEYIASKQFPIKVYPGAEVYYHEGIEDTIEKYKNYILNETSGYVLFEFPMFQTPANYLDAIFKLRLKKIRPIIAHPERYALVYEDLNRVARMIELGALIQINAGSLLGHFGNHVQEIVLKLLRYKWVHFIASDAHNDSSRPFLLDQAYDKICTDKRIDKNFIETLFFNNPRQILDGVDIDPGMPSGVEKKAGKKLQWKKIFGIK